MPQTKSNIRALTITILLRTNLNTAKIWTTT